MPTFTGTASDDVLYGGEDDDRLVGLAGDDLLDGSGGNDVLVGGEGDDIYVVDTAGDLIVEREDEGFDVVYTTSDFWLADDDYIELLSARDWFSTTPLQLFGNVRANSIVGNDGDNFIDGGAGVDLMIGRDGDDTYVIDNAFDTVAEYDGEGYDTVYTEVSYQLAADSRIERLSSRDWLSLIPLNLAGNGFENTIFGNAGANIIDGGGGADVLVGFTGNDVYLVDHVDDQVIEGLNQGADLVYTTVSYALVESSAVENLSALDRFDTSPLSLTGNRFNNVINGNAGDNIIDGGAGADTMYGGDGDDTYHVNFNTDLTVELAGEGYDVVLSSNSYILADHIEELRVLDPSSTAAHALGGNGRDNRLIGNAGENQMDGYDGSDFLDGLLGNDGLTGGVGADIFAFTTALGSNNVDTVRDFQAGVDRIALDDAIFSALTPGDLAASAFVTGTAAADADDRIIFDPATGNLIYDADGSGSGSAILFATLRQFNGAVGANDFFVL